MAAIDLSWPPLLAGAVLFQVAGLAQVFYRNLPVMIFFPIEAVLFFGGGLLIALGVVDSLWFGLAFAALWSVVVLILLALLRNALFTKSA